MKQNRFRFLSLALSGLVLFGAVSCQDDFTEEDALKAQQQVGLTIYVVNSSSVESAPVANAKVVVSQSGTTQEVTTDETGVAKFSSIQIGEFVYSVSADKFTSVSEVGSADVDNFRQGQVTAQVGLYSLEDASMATVKGNVTVDTDLTNTTREFAAVKVSVDVWLDNVGKRTFTGTTDASGNYSIKIPVNANGSDINIRYPDFSADQTIAIDRYEGEESFPATLPKIDKVSTLFSMSPDTYYNEDFSTSVRSVWGIAEAAPAGGETAVINWIYTNEDGEVTGVDFDNGGDYTGDADGKVTINITSIDGGTGASIVIDLDGYTNLESAYYNSSDVVINAGSGYPYDDNYSLNKTGYRSPSYRSSESTVRPGEEVVANADYGTGSYRGKSVDQ